MLDDSSHEKNPAAVSLGRRGGKKGGIARAELCHLNAEKRSQARRQKLGGADLKSRKARSSWLMKPFSQI